MGCCADDRDEAVLLQGTIVAVGNFPLGITWSRAARRLLPRLPLLGMIWAVTACGLARPTWWWTRRFYGLEKMRRALDRFDPARSPHPDPQAVMEHRILVAAGGGARDLLGWEPKVELIDGLRKTIELTGVERLVGATD